jgi:hypothetical protein
MNISAYEDYKPKQAISNVIRCISHGELINPLENKIRLEILDDLHEQDVIYKEEFRGKLGIKSNNAEIDVKKKFQNKMNKFKNNRARKN